MSLYEYVGSDPVTWNDPRGLSYRSVLKKVKAQKTWIGNYMAKNPNRTPPQEAYLEKARAKLRRFEKELKRIVDKQGFDAVAGHATKCDQVKGWVEHKPKRGNGRKMCKVKEGATGASLKKLAEAFSGTSATWMCLWPNEAESAKEAIAKIKAAHAKGEAPCGAVYEIDNVATAPATKATFEIVAAKIGSWYMMHDPPPETMDGSLEKYPDLLAGRKAGRALGEAAAWGRTPLARLDIYGHGQEGSPTVGEKDGTTFGLEHITSAWKERARKQGGGGGANNPKTTYALAKDRVGPPICWFGRGANIRVFGCETFPSAASAFGNFVRPGTTIGGTTKRIIYDLANPRGWMGFILKPEDRNASNAARRAGRLIQFSHPRGGRKRKQINAYQIRGAKDYVNAPYWQTKVQPGL